MPRLESIIEDKEESLDSGVLDTEWFIGSILISMNAIG